MQEIKRELNKKIPVGRLLYSGNGYLWSVKGKPNRVIKVFRCYNSISYQNLFAKLVKQNTNCIVKIYGYGSINTYDDELFYYVMEKLKPVNRREQDQLGEVVDTFYKRGYLPSFVNQKLISFIKLANKLRFYYNDIHGGNIMLDNKGNYKFVDLESFSPEE
jgi:serine/threonine protein kinase